MGMALRQSILRQPLGLLLDKRYQRAESPLIHCTVAIRFLTGSELVMAWSTKRFLMQVHRAKTMMKLESEE